MYFQSGILFWTTFVTFSHCHSIANQFYGGGEGGYGGGMGSSEEMYSGLGVGHGGPPPPEAYFHPQQEFNSGGPPLGIYSRQNQGFYPGLPQGIHSRPSQEFYPEPHQRNLMHHLPAGPGPSMYDEMPLAHNQLNIASSERFPNQGLFSHPHYFNPQIMGGLFENPLTAMMDPMRKQMTDSIKGMGDNMGKQVDQMGKQMENVGNQMGEAGKQAMDTMQKPAEELGKEMEEAMENAQDEFGKRIQTAMEGAEEFGAGVPSNSSVSDGEKKLEGLDSKKDESGEEMEDAKKKAQGAAGDAVKKMQDTGNKLRKSFPVPTAPLLGRIKDETTEAHDYESDFPRAEAMEWGSPDFVDVRHHPRSQFYDYYYDGGY